MTRSTRRWSGSDEVFAALRRRGRLLRHRPRRLEHHRGEARGGLRPRFPGRARHLPARLSARRRPDRGLRGSSGAPGDLARLRLQPRGPRRDPGGHSPSRGRLLGGKRRRIRANPRHDLAAVRRLARRLRRRRACERLRPRLHEGRDGRPLPLDSNHRLGDEQSAESLERIGELSPFDLGEVVRQPSEGAHKPFAADAELALSVCRRHDSDRPCIGRIRFAPDKVRASEGIDRPTGGCDRDAEPARDRADALRPFRDDDTQRERLRRRQLVSRGPALLPSLQLHRQAHDSFRHPLDVGPIVHAASSRISGRRTFSSSVCLRSMWGTKRTAARTSAASPIWITNTGWRAAASSAGLALAALEPSREVTFAPITVTPVIAPTVRKNWVEAVATPSAPRLTEFCTATVSVCIIRPIPRPTMTTSLVTSSWEEWTPSRARRKKPTASKGGPAISTGL